MLGQPAKESRRRRRGVQAAAIVALLLSAAAAQGVEVEKDAPRKPAWKWTLDERLAARFDPEALSAREAEDEAQQKAIRERLQRLNSDLIAEEAKVTGPPPSVETIDGSMTPELFLSLELFSILLNRGLPGEKWEGLEESRKQIERRAAALGFGRDLWDRLEKTAGSYLRLLHAEDQRRLVTGAKDYKRKAEGLRVCRARLQALEAAKTEFGEEGFLRLLYEAVAPDARRTYILEPWPPDYQRHAEELRFQEEGGCR